jgi:hypothetical protein
MGGRGLAPLTLSLARLKGSKSAPRRAWAYRAAGRRCSEATAQKRKTGLRRSQCLGRHQSPGRLCAPAAAASSQLQHGASMTAVVLAGHHHQSPGRLQLAPTICSQACRQCASCPLRWFNQNAAPPASGNLPSSRHRGRSTAWVGCGGHCSPRHRVPFNSRDEITKCVE